MLDLVGPYNTYVPKFERETRSSKKKQYKIYIAMFICVGTGCVNLQLVESQSTTGLGEAVTRFSMESGTPAVLFPDKQSGIEAFLKEASVTLKDVYGHLYKEHGIRYETCPAQAHWQHGRVERLARTIRESITREEFSSQRLHVLGWQTIIKCVENTINDIPIGFIYKQNVEAAEIMEVLCPNTFKFGRLNRRAPQAPFQVPKVDLRDYTQKVQQLWNIWWKMWQRYYVEKVFEFPKWAEDKMDAQMGDIVMFKRESTEFGSHYTMGRLDEFAQSHDGKPRIAWIKYKLEGEKNSRRVERDIKTVFKLFRVEDTTLHDMLENAAKIVEQVKRKERSEEENPADGCKGKENDFKNSDEKREDDLENNDEQEAPEEIDDEEGGGNRTRAIT